MACTSHSVRFCDKKQMADMKAFDGKNTVVTKISTVVTKISTVVAKISSVVTKISTVVTKISTVVAKISSVVTKISTALTRPRAYICHIHFLSHLSRLSHI